VAEIVELALELLVLAVKNLQFFIMGKCCWMSSSSLRSIRPP